MNMRKLMLSGLAGASALGAATPVLAQVPSYMGEVQLYAGSYCPKATAETQAQILSIATNTALFSLLGTTYGGNGQTTFALPDLRGRTPIGQGQGPGLSPYTQGQVGGTEKMTMLTGNMPTHIHPGNLRAVGGAPDTDDPNGAALADFPSTIQVYNNSGAPNVNMAMGSVTVAAAGGSQPFPTLVPYLTLRYCIVTQGIFPSRQ